MRCLRSLLHIKWQDKVPDAEVLQRAEMEGIHAILLRHQLRWAGHVHRMDDCRLPKRLFYGELSTGKRTTDRPKKRYKDTLKEALKLCTIPQATWRSRVRSGVDDFEERRIKQKEERRQKRKECQNPSPQPDPAHSFPCPNATACFVRGLASSVISARTPTLVKSWSSPKTEDEHHQSSQSKCEIFCDTKT